MNGLGTVHHVAMAIATDEEQLRLRAELIRFGCKVTEVRDRCYFQSIYFREPGGVLFEVATVGAGVRHRRGPARLGRDLKLPPWEEPYRTEIEAGLASFWAFARGGGGGGSRRGVCSMAGVCTPPSRHADSSSS